MSLRPVSAKWFELVTVHKELARVMQCLSQTGAVELEARSRPTERVLFPGFDEELKSCRELARRYQHYWPASAPAPQRRTEELSETLKAARARLEGWANEADPIILIIEKLSQNAVDLAQLRAALESAGDNFPDIHALNRAGPKLRARLFALPAEAQWQELPALVLIKRWQTADANYVLAVGLAFDVDDVETRLRGLKAHLLPLPSWLPASVNEAVTAIGIQLAGLAEQRAASTAQLQALSEKFEVAPALADIALIEWLAQHAKELYGSNHSAWITGWTIDVSGAALRRALDASGVHYILRLSDAPAGMNAPLVLSNPGWARAFEVFARMLGTPARYESDPSQLLAVIASSIFGFMFGDVGQGALICLAGIALGRHIPLTRMLCPAVSWRCFLAFCSEACVCREDIIPALWIRPMDDPITIFVGGCDYRRCDHYARAAARRHPDALARRGKALVGERAGLFTAYAGLLVSLLRTEGLLLAGLGPAWFIFGATVLTEKGRLAVMVQAAGEFVEESSRASSVNTLVIRSHRRFCACPCRTVGRHH